MSQQETTVQRPEETLKKALERAKGSFSAVAARHITPERLMKVALGAATRNPLLLQCTPASLVRAVLQGAELGLEPGSALNHAYLVPFKNTKTTPACWEVQLIVGYMGLAELAYRSGLVSFITSEVVYEGDTFEYELGLEPRLKHIPDSDDIHPDKITHAYMVVGLKDGGKVFKVMNRKQIDRIRDRSQAGKSGYSPWATDFAEMAKKTVIKNGMKLVPKSIEMARAMRLDDAVETGNFDLLEFDSPEALGMDQTPQLPESTKGVNAVKEKAAAKGATANGESPFEASFLSVLGMNEDQQREWKAYCGGEGFDAATKEAEAKAHGVKSIDELYAFATGRLM
jgi:recombination protein RecT